GTGTVCFFAAPELSRVGLRPIVVDAHEVRLKTHRPTQKSDRRNAPPFEVSRLRESLSRRRPFSAAGVLGGRASKIGSQKRAAYISSPGYIRTTSAERKPPATPIATRMPHEVGWFLLETEEGDRGSVRIRDRNGSSRSLTCGAPVLHAPLGRAK